tara:strand:+ start:5893 stop:6483 length:591 start_codon:yes stop_codon:yes gene_type:complete
MANWTQDQAKRIASLIDYNVIYLDKATYMDNANTILASFENMKAGNTENNGLIVPSPYGYDDTEPLSMTNNPYPWYFDENRQNMIHFYFESSDGNIVGDGAMIDIVIGDPISLSKTVMLNDVIPAYVAPNGVQTPGEAWITLEEDNSTYGLSWNPNIFGTTVSPGMSTWTFIQGSWTDTDITINKSKFWDRDNINP